MSMQIQIPKFLNNEAIEEFASGLKIYNDNLKLISEICANEGNKNNGASNFTYQKAVAFDKVMWSMKRDGNRSADFITIIGKKTVLIADAKFKSTTGSDVTDNPGKIREKFNTTKLWIRDNPKYEEMNLNVHERMIVVFPKLKNFPQIERKLRQMTEKPKISAFTIDDFYSTFFAS